MNEDMKDMKGKGIFNFEIDGLTNEQVHRFRESLDTIIREGVLSLHDGKAILSFDYEGKLREIKFEYNKWRRKNP
jgi:hypothetical protein